jgi:DNA-binding MarR family transcriptional regulator
MSVYTPNMGHRDDVQRCTCFNLRKATRAVTQLYDDMLRRTGLRATQFSLLAVVLELGTVSINRLADEAVMDRTTVTRNLRLLGREGLIRIQAGADGRVREVSLTAAGRARLTAALPLWAEAQRYMITTLGTTRFDRLLGDLSAAVGAAQAS